ncbi:MAG TPA: recombination mediator RecR [Candidatus Hydrothermia bacterium]|nr:recombination mediator RecR [Candidatus Hydrothermia bacterium]
MSWVPSSLKKLIENLKKLPGIGERSGFRIAYFLLKDRDTLENLIESLREVNERVKLCKICHGFSEDTDICPICTDERRNSGVLCIVERPEDVNIIESVQGLGWKYHVIGGVLSPVRGISLDKLNIFDIRDRIRKENIKEIVMALSPDVEGDATISYILQLLSDMEVSISRIAVGLPRGIDITLMDPFTLKESILGRRKLK